MTNTEQARILARALEIKAISPGALATFVQMHTGNSLDALRRALGLPRFGDTWTTRERVLTAIESL